MLPIVYAGFVQWWEVKVVSGSGSRDLLCVAGFGGHGSDQWYEMVVVDEWMKEGSRGEEALGRWFGWGLTRLVWVWWVGTPPEILIFETVSK